jgi:transcription initiation factor TFIID subunit 10
MSEPPSSSLPPQPPSSADPPQSSSEATVVPKLEPETSDPSALDAPVDMVNNTTATNAEAGAAAAAAGAGDAAAGDPAQAVVSSDTAATSKKETSLREFLGKMDEYAPIVRFTFSSFSILPHSPSSFLLYRVSHLSIQQNPQCIHSLTIKLRSRTP